MRGYDGSHGKPESYFLAMPLTFGQVHRDHRGIIKFKFSHMQVIKIQWKTQGWGARASLLALLLVGGALVACTPEATQAKD